MTTLISVHNSEGCVGRCDAKCYNAVNKECDCICGGANHGKGLARAQKNTREQAEKWLEHFRRQKGADDLTMKFSEDLIRQGGLFE